MAHNFKALWLQSPFVKDTPIKQVAGQSIKTTAVVFLTVKIILFLFIFIILSRV